MFFVDSTDIWYATAQSDVIDTKASQIVPAAMEKYPMDVDYSKIALGYVEMNYKEKSRASARDFCAHSILETGKLQFRLSALSSQAQNVVLLCDSK